MSEQVQKIIDEQSEKLLAFLDGLNHKLQADWLCLLTMIPINDSQATPLSIYESTSKNEHSTSLLAKIKCMQHHILLKTNSSEMPNVKKAFKELFDLSHFAFFGEVDGKIIVLQSDDEIPILVALSKMEQNILFEEFEKKFEKRVKH